MLRNSFRLIFFGCTLALCLVVIQTALSQSTGFRRVTNTSEEALNLNPTLSGDGQHIAFESTADIARNGDDARFRAFRADIASNATSFLQFSLSRAVAPALSQDGSRIAFASNDDPLGLNTDGNSEIFLFDGGALAQVTSTSPQNSSERLRGGCFQPSISDDGRFVAFASDRNITGENADGNSEIFIYDSFEQSFIQLTESSAPLEMSYAKISGDGSSIAYIRVKSDVDNEAGNLILQKIESGNAVAVEDHLLGLSLAYGRAISDDGKRVVYSAEDGNHVLQIFLYDGKNDVTRQLTSFTDFNGDVSFQPTISGDGTRIAFATRRAIAGSNSDGSVELYVYDIPTAQFTRLTNAPSQAKAEIVSSLSDDGSVIAFNFPRIISGAVETAANSNNSEIYVSQIAPRPQYFDDLKILNGASFGNEASQETVVAPGSITVARGRALAIATEQAHPGIDGDFPISFLGTSVFVNGRRAQILFVSPTQVNFVLPDETVEGAAQVVVTNGDGFQSLGKALVSQAAPGLFTFSGDGRGDGVILDADTQSRGPFDPTNGQLRLNVFATGLRHAQHVSASLAGMNATVESIQQSTTLPGLDEIHLLLPSDIRGAGTMRLTVTCDGLESNSVTLMLAGDSLRDLLINEILADPPDGLAGDANHDGTRSSSQDEFVEIVNTTAHDINLTGYKLLSRSAAGVDGVRHTFAQGAILQAGGAVVIFGGGTPPVSNAVFGGATVLTASSASLGPLNNSGGVVTLIDNANRIVSFVSYGDAGGLRGDANQSLTRSPDITGAFALHQSASGSNGRAFSPGTHLDGTPFTTRPVYRVEIVPSASSIFINATQQFTARAFDSQDNEMSGLIFVWQSSSTAIANVNADGLATGLSEGAAEIRASTRGVQSAAAVLTVKPVPPVLTRIEVSPSNVTIPFGVTRSFTARAFDQLDREMSGISFTWSSGDTSVATIDQAGSASAIKPGASTITATAQNVKGETVLNVVEPALIFNEVLADPPGSSSTDLIGDANHDGVRDSGDEFIELVNQSSSTLNITGWTIRTRSLSGITSTLRHTFSVGTTIPAGDAIAIFGGGNIDADNPAFGGAPSIKASTGQLSLTNTGLFITVNDDSGNVMAEFAYGGATGLRGDQDQSLTRSPDISGSFVLHTASTGASGRRFSPGTKTDGSFFVPRKGRLTSVALTPASAELFVGATFQFTAQAFDQFNRPLAGAILNFSSSDTNFASIENVDADQIQGSARATVKGIAVGMAQISASASDGAITLASSASTLNVKPEPPRITRIEVTPLNSPVNRGGVKQFTATAFDQNNQTVAGALFTWASSNPLIATVDAQGLARGTGAGVATISASASSGSGGTVSGEAKLNVQVPILINEILADPPGSVAADLAGDANRDGVRDSDDDEFIEVMNNSADAVDISGLAIADSTATRFTFPANTLLSSGRAAIIFGGGNPPASDPAFGGALVFTTSSLSLNNSGDTVTLKLSISGSDLIIATQTYGAEGGADQSLTRSPDAEVLSTGGSFIAHTIAPNSSGRTLSPGTRADGTPFGSPPVTRIVAAPSSNTLDLNETQTFVAQAFGNVEGSETEILNVSFIWDSSDASKAGVSPSTGRSTKATAKAPGIVSVRARAGSAEGSASLTINPPPPVLTSATLTASSSAVIIGETAQLNAHALDQYSNAVGNITFSFTSSDANVASIENVNTDSSGSATATVTGLHSGSTQIRATASDGTRTVTSDPLTLTVSNPPPPVARVEVTPASATIGAGATQQFIAHAFDSDNQEIAGTTFSWSSSAPDVATINQGGLATGVGQGTTQITATCGGVTSAPSSLTVARRPAADELIVNEVLANPGASGDANRDGTGGGGASSDQRDEFVEILNPTSVPLDLSLLNLYDNTATRRHQFPANTILQPGKAIIIFGGETGTPTASNIPGIAPGVDSRLNAHPNISFGGAIVQVASSYGLSGSATSGLGLNNTGNPADCIRIVNGTITGSGAGTINGTLLSESCYTISTSTPDKSFTRSDTETGGNRNFTITDFHPVISNVSSPYNGRQFSPGFRRDGNPFQ